MKQYKYFSGFSVWDYAIYKQQPFKGKGWNITFEEFTTKNQGSITAIINEVEYPSKTVVINASSLERAQHVSELLYAASCLQFGTLHVAQRPNVRLIDGLKKETLIGASHDGVPLTCMIAAKASFSKQYQYALFKHLESHELISSEPADHDPSHWFPSKFVFSSVDYHVRCAYAIVIAYSVIEELSLELRASNTNPSFIKGEWNPSVRAELERRLLQARINLKETFLWELRDTPTSIERAHPPKFQTKASWAYGKIRDGEMELVDALAQASWLRSKVSAHKLRELAGALNYYEVFNVQHLARRLLLEKMGFWRKDDVFLEM
jgi:hypothetical protein